MQFRTELHISKPAWNLDHHYRIASLGSCFASTMGQKLYELKFNILNNPFGTLFNPLSISSLIRDALQDRINEDRIIRVQELYISLDMHSQVYAGTKEKLMEGIKTRQEKLRAYLKDQSLLIITLGSAFVYKWKEDGRTVGNCHKLPSSEFEKILLDPTEIEQALKDLIVELKIYNPGLKVILTLSPVRHIKDGIAENQLSKSILRVVCSRIAMDPMVDYFPAYEIMMDDLRDYRFYKEDMIHPTAQAEEYIFQKFSEYFSADTQALIKKVENFRKRFSHRFLSENKMEQLRFWEETRALALSFQEELDFSTELMKLDDKLNKKKNP